MGKEREGLSRNMYKGPVDKNNGGENSAECGRWRWVGWGESNGGKWGQL